LLGKIAARFVASQCFVLGLIAASPGAQARALTRTVLAAVSQAAPVFDGVAYCALNRHMVKVTELRL
jgi:hypothetical protein